MKKRLDSGEIISLDQNAMHIVYERIGGIYTCTICNSIRLRRVSDIDFDKFESKVRKIMGGVIYEQ